MDTGYEEYIGAFGPLGGKVDPHRRYDQVFPSGRSLRRLRDRPRVPAKPRQADDYAAFIEQLSDRRKHRKRKWKQESANILEIDEEEFTQQSAACTDTSRNTRHVWLPARDFAFRERSGKLDTRSLARLDIKKIVDNTDVDTIQKHLENLAFADVSLEDVECYSDGQFLKLFQVAQLTLEYLMNVQDSLVTHSTTLEAQCSQFMTECRQIDEENEKYENEIAALKKEIRHKQRTMATLETMLVSLTVQGNKGKENSEVDANMSKDQKDLVNSLIQSHENVLPSKPLDCVLCGKRFLSPEYLIRHQAKQHRKEAQSEEHTRNNTKQSPSAPDNYQKKSDESKELSEQLAQLQEELKAEKERRYSDNQHAEQQQSDLSRKMNAYMEKLQRTLSDMDRKQEESKSDLIKYTRDAIANMQIEAKSMLVNQTISRAGAILHDDSVKTDRAPVWLDKMGSMVEALLRAQEQKQQQIDALIKAQQHGKSKIKKHHTEPTSVLQQLALLEAYRFGVDRSSIPSRDVHDEIPAVEPIKPSLEDKQTSPPKAVQQCCQVVQTEEKQESSPSKPSTGPPVKVVVGPKKEEKSPQKPTPVGPSIKNLDDEKKELSPKDAVNAIIRVVRGYFARKNFMHLLNAKQQLKLPISLLKKTLTDEEWRYAMKRHNLQSVQQLSVQVPEALTANELRAYIASILFDKSSASSQMPGRTDAYHRVLLYERHSSEEIYGQMQINSILRSIRVEIVSKRDAEKALQGAVSYHSRIDNRASSIRKQSMELPRKGSMQLEAMITGDRKNIQSLIRVQSAVKRHLAKRQLEIRRLERVINGRLYNAARAVDDKCTANYHTLDTGLQSHILRIHSQLADRITKYTKYDDTLPSLELARLTHRVQQERGHLSDVLQERIKAIDRCATNVMHQVSSSVIDNPHAVSDKDLLGSARSQFEKLLASASDTKAPVSQAEQTSITKRLVELAKTVDVANSNDKQSVSSDEAIDNEVKTIADAYEKKNCNTGISVAVSPLELDNSDYKTFKTTQPMSDTALQKSTSALKRSALKAPAIHKIHMSAKPIKQSDQPGMSPRPDKDTMTISPFSSTPILSRRTGAIQSRQNPRTDSAR